MNSPATTAAPTAAAQPATPPAPGKITVATTWLDGCSGCHMSFLDMDERLVDLADRIHIVYSPLVDAKDLPEQVDLGILEGSVSNEEDLHKVKAFRKHCKLLVSLGDCAVNGNVPAMRNPFKLDAVIERAYRENVDHNPQIPTEGVPRLLKTVLPLHAVVPVDVFIPGCPPCADAIFYVLSELIAGRTPDPITVTRFGA
ncbi:MAG: NADP oxidoreductase [Chromatiaceae bacterium]|nr:MAG: NADP oxidoreductase [Chromatiaceae bacterium]